jgi:hypothetical protein
VTRNSSRASERQLSNVFKHRHSKMNHIDGCICDLPHRMGWCIERLDQRLVSTRCVHRIQNAATACDQLSHAFVKARMELRLPRARNRSATRRSRRASPRTSVEPNPGPGPNSEQPCSGEIDPAIPQRYLQLRATVTAYSAAASIALFALMRKLTESTAVHAAR